MSSPKLTSDLQLKMSGLVIHDEEHDIVEQVKSKENDQQNSDKAAVNQKEVEFDGDHVLQSICLSFIEDMNTFGISVLDDFLGNERGNLVYEEVINLHRAGLFTDGQLVRNETKNKDIRGDEIIWLVGNESACPNITGLINDIDCIVLTANKLPNNGQLGKYKIDGRTKVSLKTFFSHYFYNKFMYKSKYTFL